MNSRQHLLSTLYHFTARESECASSVLRGHPDVVYRAIPRTTMKSDSFRLCLSRVSHLTFAKYSGVYLAAVEDRALSLDDVSTPSLQKRLNGSNWKFWLCSKRDRWRPVQRIPVSWLYILHARTATASSILFYHTSSHQTWINYIRKFFKSYNYLSKLSITIEAFSGNPIFVKSRKRDSKFPEFSSV